MRHSAGFVLALVLAAPPTAQAFLGFGDVSFDPAAHAELVRIYEQALALYRITREQVRRTREVANFVHAAETDRTVFLKTPLRPLLRRALSLGHAEIPARITDIASDYRRVKTSVAALVALTRATRRIVVRLDSVMPGTQAGTSVVARNTALLAMFAASRAADAQAKKLAGEHAIERQAKAMHSLASIYQAMGR